MLARWYPANIRPELVLQKNNLHLLNPFLAALIPVVFLYAGNVNEVPLDTFLSVLGQVLLASALFSLVVWGIFRDHVRAGFLATAWIILFLAAGHVFDELLGRSIVGFEINRYRHLAVLTVVFAATTLYMSVWRPKICLSLTPYISVILGLLVLFNVASIIVRAIDEPDWGKPEPTGLAELDLVAIKPDNLPDIYYILLDSYPRGDTLQEVFNFDNGDFLGSLETEGFFIASESRANYVQTFLSLPSSLNMAHLDYLTDTVGADSKDSRILRSLVRNSEVPRFAADLGYKIIHLSSEAALIDWIAGRSNVDADVDRPSLGNYPVGGLGRMVFRPIVGNDFGFTVFNKTLVGHASVSHRSSPLLGSLGEYVDQWIRANRASTYVENVDRMTSISNDEGPTFTFAHFLPPHPPYVFDGDGNVPRGRIDFKDWTLRDLYIAQLTWVNKTIGAAVEKIQKNDGKTSIIILQGDHGTLSTDPDRIFKVGGTPTKELIEERSAILNAYFLPSSCEPDGFYPSITPVNSFRVIFNSCFGADLELLKDQSYWSMAERPFDFNLGDDLLDSKKLP